MKCPCCQREMLPGTLRSFDIADLYFVPESPEEPRVTLKKRMVFRSLGFERKGSICRTCELVLLDYGNGKS